MADALADVGSDIAADPSGLELSKKQQRKLRKRERQLQRREEKRRQRAAGAEELKRKLAAEWEALTEEERGHRQLKSAQARAQRLQERQAALAIWKAAYQSGPRVVIDMDFEELMREPEIRSLCQQVMYCWSIIRRASQPVQLSLCGLRPRQPTHAILMRKAGVDQWQIPMTAEPFHTQRTRTGCIVYLTADSPNVLHSLEADKIYVIGGIVDHNRHKALTLTKAMDHQCAHAQLPLGEFLDLQASGCRFSKVLTVNHMVDILTTYHETKDWQAAFLRVIPSRKDVRPTASGEDLSDSAGASAHAAEDEGLVDSDSGPTDAGQPLGDTVPTAVTADTVSSLLEQQSSST